MTNEAIIKKATYKFDIALKKYEESKKDIDNLRQYRNATQRILNLLNKNEIKNYSIYFIILKSFLDADNKVKELFKMNDKDKIKQNDVI